MNEFTSFWGGVPFSAEVLHEDGDHDLVSYSYPGAVRNSWVPGISVKVSPASGEEWVGNFLRGNESPNGIDLCCAHPDGKRLIVVSKGTGYVVSVDDPSQWEEVPLRPILGYAFDADSRTLAMIDYTRVIGVGKEGYIWKTPSLSWDGLKDVEVRNGFLIGKGWNAATSEFVAFEVSLSDGRHSGGSSPPIIR